MFHLQSLGLAIFITIVPVSAIPQQTISKSSEAFSTTSATAPTITSTSIVSLPEDDEARTCWSSYYSWSVLSNDIQESARNSPWTPVDVFPVYVSTECCWPSTEKVPVTTLCDGYPRLVRTPQVFYNISSITTFYNYTLKTQGVLPSMTEKTPDCTIGSEEPACTRFWDDWNSHSYYHTTYDNSIYFGRPPCSSSLKQCPTSTRCTVEASSVTMYYWPQTTTSGDFCARNGTTVTPAPTDLPFPDKVTSGDVTFTSPSVYLVASRVYGWVFTRRYQRRSRGYLCGTDVKSVTTYTVDPEEISTIDGRNPGTTLSMDWTDLTTIHFDAYLRQCQDRYCTRGWGRNSTKTITPGNGVPFVALPSAVHKEVPEWESCEVRGGFLPVLVPLGEGTFEDNSEFRKLLVESSKTIHPTAPATNTDARSTQTQDMVDISSIPTPDPDADTVEESQETDTLRRM